MAVFLGREPSLVLDVVIGGGMSASAYEGSVPLGTGSASLAPEVCLLDVGTLVPELRVFPGGSQRMLSPYAFSVCFHVLSTTFNV